MNEKKKKNPNPEAGGERRVQGHFLLGALRGRWGRGEKPSVGAPRARELWHGRKVSQGEHAGKRGGREGVYVCVWCVMGVRVNG